MEVPSRPRQTPRLGLWLPPASPHPGGDGSFADLVAAVEAAEVAGFDSVWVSDQVPGPLEIRAPGTGTWAATSFEAYSLLGALATRTRSLRLGTIPSIADGRAPSIVAKIVTGLDVISHGRSTVAFRLDMAAPAIEIERTIEAVQVCRQVLDDDRPVFDGRFFHVDGAVNHPRPVQPGGVPLVVFVESGQQDPTGQRGLLEMSPLRAGALRRLAELADAFVVGGDVDAVQDVVSSSGSASVIWIGQLVVEPHGSPRGVVVAGDDLRSAPGRQTQWLDDLTSSTTHLADALNNRLQAGAAGCIVSLVSPDLLESIARVGPMLSQLVLDEA